MRNTETISNRNTIVLPKYALQALGAKAGDRLRVVVEGKTVRLIPVAAAAAPADKEGKGPTERRATTPDAS